MDEQQHIDERAILWSRPLEHDRPLLVLMHGRGSDEADLFGLAPFLPSGPVIASIRAPIPEGPGFCWYRMDSTDPAVQASDIDRSVQCVLDWFDSLPAVSSLGLLGFSQGGVLALELMRHRPHAFSCVVQLSGYVFQGVQPGDSELTDLHVPVFWGYGSSDFVIPREWIERTAQWLPKHAKLETRVYNVGHSVTEEELTEISSFVNEHL